MIPETENPQEAKRIYPGKPSMRSPCQPTKVQAVEMDALVLGLHRQSLRGCFCSRVVVGEASRGDFHPDLPFALDKAQLVDGALKMTETMWGCFLVSAIRSRV